MANISLTQVCNQRCTYCFAQALPSRREMRPADFRALLELLGRSGVDEARLVGGEPTLHPEFPSLVKEAAGRGLQVRVFSNGLMPGPALSALQALPPDRCSVLINTPCPLPATGPSGQLEKTLQALGPRAGIGINIYRPRLPIESVLPLIDRYGLRRTVRLGLAHPCLGADNAFLHPRHYATVGREILQLFQDARERQIAFSFDCGFVPCMFPPEFWEHAGPAANEVGGQCGPIPDILPDLTAIPCYALGNLTQYPVSGCAKTGDLVRRFQERLAVPGGLGLFAHCRRCDWRARGRCNGGCAAAGLRRCHGWEENPLLLKTERAPAARASFRATGITRAIPVAARPREHRRARSAPATGEPSWVLPYIDQPADFWQNLAERHGSRISSVYFPLPDGRIPTGRPVQPERHLSEFMRQRWLPKNVLINPVALPAPAEIVFPGLLDELTRLVEVHGVTSATVADLPLAGLIRSRFPRLHLTASVLMNIVTPEQARGAAGIFDALVPGSGLIRWPDRLGQIRAAFPGKLRLLVNEGCLFGCALRARHFYEMAYGDSHPESLCAGLLAEQPWRRVTGAWVLPQHLHWLDAFADEYKLAGRATLQDPAHYLRVCDAYLHRTALWPDEIGGGPASLLDKLPISQGLARYLLSCGQQCHDCQICRRLMNSLEPAALNNIEQE